MCALGLANATEWKAFCAKKNGNRRVLPVDIPSAPDRVYADQGWISFGNWLGNDHVHASKIEYATYDDARAFVRSLGIETGTEWRAYCRGEIHRSTPRPLHIPTNPHRTYRGRGWRGWGHFLGTNAVAVYNRKFRSYKAARDYVRKQGLVDSKDWRAWCAAGKRPPDIPGAPDLIYKDKGWTTWGDFFGTANIHPAQMLTAREAMPIVRALGIRNRTEFMEAKRTGKLPNNVPLTIDRRPDWIGWDSFLGTGT